jgi:hypothetical protein
MDNTFFTPDQPNKDKGFQSQKQIVFEALYGQPKTMLMAALETGILRANICRYVAEFRKDGKIRLTHYGLCKVTKHRAGIIPPTRS